MSMLSGRVALVVGASSGIGAATARALADAGADVHAAARRRPELGHGVTGHAVDVTNRRAVDELAGCLTARGPVHAVVVAAGTNVPRRSLAALAPDDWDRLIAVNLTGAFNVVRALLEPLRAERGHVVLVGSVSGSWPDFSGPAYQAAKAGLLAFARAAGLEEHDRAVRFTTVLPGLVDTPLMDERPEPPSEAARAQMLKPEDVAAACLFAITLPPRAHVPELTILPTALECIGNSNAVTPLPRQ